MICEYCHEPIDDDEIEHPAVQVWNTHKACMFRMVSGSVAHLERRCSCYVPGATEGDPAGMTLRQGAIAAVETFSRLNRCEILKFPSIREAHARHLKN
jgi:hypothetical protein